MAYTNTIIMIRKRGRDPAQAVPYGRGVERPARRLRSAEGQARRGFIFSLDAMFATVILIALISAIYLFSSQQSSSVAPLANLERKAASILLMLERNGTFQSGDTGTMANSINGMIASSMVNQTSIAVGETLGYMANVTDSATVTYGVNDTARFYIDPATGVLANTTELGVGDHTVRLTATDTAGNSASFDLTIMVTP